MKYFNFIFLYAIIFFSCTKTELDNKKNTPLEILFIEEGWVRPGNAGMMSAAYFTIRNNVSVDDTLESISSNASTDTPIHESYEQENNIKGMRQMNIIPIPANSAIELKPSGMHIMIIRPEFDLIAGDSVTFILEFSHFGNLEINLPVR